MKVLLDTWYVAALADDVRPGSVLWRRLRLAEPERSPLRALAGEVEAEG